jgi:hypothetical protein
MDALMNASNVTTATTTTTTTTGFMDGDEDEDNPLGLLAEPVKKPHSFVSQTYLCIRGSSTNSNPRCRRMIRPDAIRHHRHVHHSTTLGKSPPHHAHHQSHPELQQRRLISTTMLFLLNWWIWVLVWKNLKWHWKKAAT